MLYFVLKFAGVYTWIQFSVPCATAVISAIMNIFKDAKEKEPVKIISMSFNYMLEGGADVSNILDILISNKQKKRVFKNSKSLFKVILARLQLGNYEDKRLIAESIGSLYKINRKQTKSLIEVLRDDTPCPPWNDDIRRRVIEELDYIDRRDKAFIIEQLTMKDSDTIYTIIAVMEIIYFSKFFSLKEKKTLFEKVCKKLTDFGEIEKNVDENEFLKDVKEFAGKIHDIGKNKDNLKKLLVTVFQSTANQYIKVFIAKNISCVCTAGKVCAQKNKCIYPERQKYVLDLFALCFNDTSNKNIRRAMAKEEVCHCLLYSLAQKQYQRQITDNIWMLVKDDDYIIPNTFLDYASRLFEADKNLYHEVIKYFTDDNAIIDLTVGLGNIIPKELSQYLDIIKTTELSLYKKTIHYYLKANENKISENNNKRLFNRIELQKHAKRADKNIKALQADED
jgi:hypothetical protein